MHAARQNDTSVGLCLLYFRLNCRTVISKSNRYKNIKMSRDVHHSINIIIGLTDLQFVLQHPNITVCYY
jgi:hypothetical protein